MAPRKQVKEAGTVHLSEAAEESVKALLQVGRMQGLSHCPLLDLPVVSIHAWHA